MALSSNTVKQFSLKTSEILLNTWKMRRCQTGRLMAENSI